MLSEPLSNVTTLVGLRVIRRLNADNAAWTIDAPQGLRMFKVFSFSIPRMICSGGPR
ncbi:hypothetical protein OKW41_000176 [Paraburkholderia sp. UCT70]